MIRAAEHGRSGERYILGGTFVTLGDVAGALAQVTGLPAPRWRIPYPIAWAYAALAQTWAQVSGGETLRDEVAWYRARGAIAEPAARPRAATA